MRFVNFFPMWIGFGYYNKERLGSWSMVYKWCICLGFWEIRVFRF